MALDISTYSPTMNQCWHILHSGRQHLSPEAQQWCGMGGHSMVRPAGEVVLLHRARSTSCVTDLCGILYMDAHWTFKDG